jgi:hypothetical protein
MENNELLKPRFKFIADYPLSHMYLNVGDVLTFKNDNGIERYVGGKDASMHPDTVNSFPRLFRELQWWEERKIEEMPEYVKDKYPGLNRKIEYYHAYKWANVYSKKEPHFEQKNMFKETYWTHAQHTTPATKEEYDAYMNQEKL